MKEKRDLILSLFPNDRIPDWNVYPAIYQATCVHQLYIRGLRDAANVSKTRVHGRSVDAHNVRELEDQKARLVQSRHIRGDVLMQSRHVRGAIAIAYRIVACVAADSQAAVLFAQVPMA